MSGSRLNEILEILMIGATGLGFAVFTARRGLQCGLVESNDFFSGSSSRSPSFFMESTKVHVAVLAFPFGTHAGPLFALTCRLAKAAPYATFSFFNLAKSNRPIFASSSSCVDNIKAYDVDDGIPEGYVFTGKMYEDIDMFTSVTPNNFKRGLEEAELDTGKNITCLLTDAFIWQAADMAQKMNVPWVPYWTAGTPSLCAHFYTDLIRDTIGALDDPSAGKDLPLNFVPGMPSSLQVKDLPIQVCNLESLLSGLLHQMGRTIHRGTAVALCSFEELNPSVINDFKSSFHQCLAVGPCALTSPSPPTIVDPKGCIPWLDGQKPTSVVYICFGTVVAPPNQELIALAEALEESGVAFLWSLKDHLKVQLPPGFLDRTSHRGLVVPWAPQLQVLEHASVGVFVTHCGWNSVNESIIGGVPMICRPFFGDQPLNGLLVSKVWEFGVVAENANLSKDGLMEALNLILSKDAGKKMREKVGVLKDLAKQAVGPKGSSTRNFNTLLEIVTTINSS